MEDALFIAARRPDFAEEIGRVQVVILEKLAITRRAIQKFAFLGLSVVFGVTFGSGCARSEAFSRGNMKSLLAVFFGGCLIGGGSVWLFGPSSDSGGVSRKSLSGANAANLSTENVSPIVDRSIRRTGIAEEEEQFATRLHDLETLGSNIKRQRALMMIADGISPAAVQQTLAQLAARKGIRDKQLVIAKLLARWAEADPHAAMTYAKSLNPYERRAAILSIIETWSEHDLAGAEQWVTQLPTGPDRNASYLAIANSVAQRDPERALALAQKGGNAMQCMYFIFNQWASRDPRKAAEGVGRLPEEQQQSVMGRVMIEWVQTDPGAAIEYANSLPQGKMRTLALSSGLAQWANVDPDAAIKYASSLPDGVNKNALLEGMSYGMLWQDPERAVTVIEKMSPGNAQDNVLRDLSRKWMGNDPRAAMDWVQQQTDDHVKQVLWPEVIETMAQSDPQGAVELALKLPKGEAQDSAFGGAVRQWAEKDIQAAVSYALSLESGEMRENAIVNTASVWAETEPKSAAAWVVQLADGPDKNNALQTVANQWIRNDLSGAAEWVQSLPAGEAKDTVLSDSSYSVLRADPEKAIEWVSGISNEKKRAQQLENVARNWLRQDPDAAGKWIANSSLAAEVKTKLLQQKR